MARVDPNVGFFSLPESKFPVTLRAFRVADDVEVWSETISEPAAIEVPPLAKEHGPVWTRVEFGNGESWDAR